MENEKLIAIIQELVSANEGLSKFKNGKTLYELPILTDDECLMSWARLNEAIRNAKKVLP